MAVADHGWAVHFSVFLLAVALEWGMNCKAAASSLGDKVGGNASNLCTCLLMCTHVVCRMKLFSAILL